MRSRACFESVEERQRTSSGDKVVPRLTVSSEERDGGAVAAGTTSTADTMDIVLRVVRVVIVEHVSNVLDILKRTELVQPCFVRCVSHGSNSNPLPDARSVWCAHRQHPYVK